MNALQITAHQRNRQESTLEKDSSVHLIFHDPSDLESVFSIRIVQKECALWKARFSYSMKYALEIKCTLVFPTIFFQIVMKQMASAKAAYCWEVNDVKDWQARVNLIYWLEWLLPSTKLNLNLPLFLENCWHEPVSNNPLTLLEQVPKNLLTYQVWGSK